MILSQAGHDPVGKLVSRLIAGDRAALARAITLAENGGSIASELHRKVYPLTGRALVVGFTGPPGAGKSCLIDAYLTYLRKLGRSVAVAAVDPTSPITGGAVLGDRFRMGRHTSDPGVFIRSIASRGHLGGLSESIHRVIDLMDAAGRDLIVVETVGTGQSEVEIVEIADIRVLVNAPGLGDDMQAIKAGILEVADILVVNKADLPLADRTTRQLESMLRLRPQEQQNVPVIQTIATGSEGIDLLAETIDRLATHATGKRPAIRLGRVKRLLAQAAARQIRAMLLEDESKVLAKTLLEVSQGHMDVDAAARAWLESRHEV